MTEQYCIHCGEELDGVEEAVGHYTHYHPSKAFDRSWYLDDEDVLSDTETTWVPFGKQPAVDDGDSITMCEMRDCTGLAFLYYAAHDPTDIRFSYVDWDDIGYIEQEAIED